MRQMFKFKLFRVLLVCVLALLCWTASRFFEFGVEGVGAHKSISFQHGTDVLSGTLIMPSGVASPPFVILVHGDGPQDRWSNDGYVPLVRYLVSKGIAVFSWDKPGVGLSTGNWFAQTMQDRANESAAAMQRLRAVPELKLSEGGFLGFSQAGWVVPEASRLVNADFVALVGAAINWRNQSLYYTGERLTLAGSSTEVIAKAQAQDALEFDQQFSIEMAKQPCASVCDRSDFERRNSLSDAQKSISQMLSPTLLVMGAQDRNVDHNETVEVWRREFPKDVASCIKQIPYATHGLLRSELFDYQLTSQWPTWKQIAFVILGRYAYSPSALESIAVWIKEQSCS